MTQPIVRSTPSPSVKTLPVFASAALLFLLFAVLSVLPLAAAPGKYQDWPVWSGPEGNMTSLGNGVFDRDSFGLEVAWTRDLGSGYSGIVVVDGKVVTGFADGDSDYLGAFDTASGDELWRYRIGEIYAGHDGSDDGPNATPSVHGGVVYGLGAWGHLFAVNLADGSEVWAQRIDEAFGARQPNHGFTTAPTVLAGKLLVQMGGEGGRAIGAFDPKTGKLLWSAGDDMVSYQTPMAITVGGKEQIVAVSDAHIAGLDPADGEVLWYVVNDSGRGHGFSHPIPVGDDGILLGYMSGHKLYRVREKDGAYSAEEVWTSRHLRGTYAVPAPYEGYLYGLAGRFLTCIDASNGELVWKSRPPGGSNLMLVDGHLVIQTNDGEIVVAEASPEGYVEKARVAALDRGYYTRPSFADGRVFVRNLTQLTAVAVTDAAPAVVSAMASAESAAEAPELKGVIADLARDLGQAGDKGKKIDAFLAKHERSPILDGDHLVHFVFRGDEPDLAVGGNMIPGGGERVMHRMEGTDFWFRTFELPPRSYYSYYLTVFDDQRPDPRNSDKIQQGRREQSVFGTQGFEWPAFLDEPAGARGRLEPFTWKSAKMENEREVQVYLPAGYDGSDARYPVLVHHHGDRALGETRIVNALDNLSGQSVEPTIVAFVPRRSGAEYSGNQAVKFVDALAEELIPYLDEHYRTKTEARSRAALGPGSAGALSVYSAVLRPDVFGHAAAIEFYYGGLQEELEAAVAAGKGSKADFFVQWSTHGYKPPNFPDTLAESQDVAEKLRAGGLEVRTHEVGHGFGWSSWQLATGDVLEAFFPLK